MCTLTATRGRETFIFRGDLVTLIIQAGEYDTARITDPDGNEVYALSFPALLAKQTI